VDWRQLAPVVLSAAFVEGSSRLSACVRAVFEMSSAIGYSTLWILMALLDNGDGHLTSIDLVQTQFPAVLPASARGTGLRLSTSMMHLVCRSTRSGVSNQPELD